MTRLALLYPAGAVAADLVIKRDAARRARVTCQHCHESIDLSDLYLLAFLQNHRECVARATDAPTDQAPA